MPKPPDNPIIIIGAGIGGLSAALRLAIAGESVLVLEKEAEVGGKIRQFDSPAGPVDAGPTVVTFLPEFAALFDASGARLDDFVETERVSTLARHYWSDGTVLDLTHDSDANEAAIRNAFGATSMLDYRNFHFETATLFDLFDAPIMRAPFPKLRQVIRTTLKEPNALRVMARRSLARYLKARFREPRLQQLFGRYATYVGGSPNVAPALLALIWQAEFQGVWAVKGGVKALANAFRSRAEMLGADFICGAEVSEIAAQNGNVTGVKLSDGRVFNSTRVLYNGDPAALAEGLLGADVSNATKLRATRPPALSAHVWAFGAEMTGIDLAHHNVFFADRPNSEFDDIRAGRIVSDPTLYLCAPNRSFGIHTPGQPEPVQVIQNAGAVGTGAQWEDPATCHQKMFQRLEKFGLTAAPEPETTSLVMPTDFATLFPGSNGSLYGRSPNAAMASFQRPHRISRVGGLFLAGGGVHPGAGMPMAFRSGQHAAEAILTHPTSR